MALNRDKSDVEAKEAFIAELTRRGTFDAGSIRVTAKPADIVALRNGVPHHFELKWTQAKAAYFGAGTLTEWSAALAAPDRYWFVIAVRRGNVWSFVEYTPAEFMNFCSIPPFKIFFHIPISAAGDGKAVRTRKNKSALLADEARLRFLDEAYQHMKAGHDPRNFRLTEPTEGPQRPGGARSSRR